MATLVPSGAQPGVPGPDVSAWPGIYAGRPERSGQTLGVDVCDVVRHVVDTQRDFLHRAGLDLPEPVDVVTEPVPAWTAHRATVKALLSDRGVADRVLHQPLR